MEPATEGDGLGQLHPDGLAAHQALAQPQIRFELAAAQTVDVGLLGSRCHGVPPMLVDVS